ncbi:hypothetical protein A3709_20775 [Halioglobus sp. HI00S01]|uniref:DUF559 domain-containing protein n=1 Tax=Halioglobus sp. HI00S01 TaxID=1822214 RepID=UPI0007C2B4F6|nr:DUF559 domain-containing protein [Halioglobus sp. HI00S01]KZX58049.1 hypothetical protein A3709_20775 [Halioglobus sp. HI00S01]
MRNKRPSIKDLKTLLPAKEVDAIKRDAKRQEKAFKARVAAAGERDGVDVTHATLSGQELYQRKLYDALVAVLGEDEVIWEKSNLVPGRKFRADIGFASASRLICEMDGYGPHFRKEAFQSDRRRSNILVHAGYRILHFYAAQIVSDEQLKECVALVVSCWDKYRDDGGGV